MVESKSLEKEMRKRELTQELCIRKRAYEQAADPMLKTITHQQWILAYSQALMQWATVWGYPAAELAHLKPVYRSGFVDWNI